MEAEMETPPKNKGHRMFVVRQGTLDNVIKSRGEAVEAKHLIKSRFSFESTHLQHMEKHKNSTLKIVESASSYPVFKKFNEKYMAEIQNSIVLQQSIVSKLGEAEGPYEMMKQWLDAPNTTTKPEELKKQLAAFYEEHGNKIKQLRKETKALRKIKDQLESCQDKLRCVQAALKRDFERKMVVSAGQMKEQKNLKGKIQELYSRREKSVQSCRGLLTEENEIRERMQKGMIQIAAEIHKFDTERVKATNDAMTKFAWILNQQEVFRKDKRNATFDLVAEVNPRFIIPPKAVPISKENTNCILYKFPDYAERLREMGFSEETTSSPETTTSPVVKPDGSSDGNAKTKPSSSKDADDGSTNQSTSKDTGYNSTKPSSSKETENSSTKPTANRSDEKGRFTEETQRSKKKVSPQLVEDEEKPKRKVGKPPGSEDSENENDKPPHVPKQVWVGGDDDKEKEKNEQVAVNNGEPEIEPDVPGRDENQPCSYGAPLEEPLRRVALVEFLATDNTFLSFKQGQKLVQTHTPNEAGLLFGYTRKHAYSQIKHGYFIANKTGLRTIIRKNIVKNLFRNK
ncbi:uncharacterized protein LOC110465244 [Mizuhopecten yessoensis]|uniref:Uncharacterized protein n=1 Tax=Mizuhopecten yessoensis TaxID=6573 RepID=A0A210PS34_MIZYE|nr:uncharacterized protein LOC110465244 [Mizuhopecten yessoensis]OWF39264.1 hypothetical protein KP79_PYT20730 [Mizuhopecten yessoensis]